MAGLAPAMTKWAQRNCSFCSAKKGEGGPPPLSTTARHLAVHRGHAHLNSKNRQSARASAGAAARATGADRALRCETTASCAQSVRPLRHWGTDLFSRLIFHAFCRCGGERGGTRGQEQGSSCPQCKADSALVSRFIFAVDSSRLFGFWR